MNNIQQTPPKRNRALDIRVTFAANIVIAPREKVLLALLCLLLLALRVPGATELIKALLH